LKAILTVFPILIYVLAPKNQLFPLQATAAFISLCSSFTTAYCLSRGKALPKRMTFSFVIFYCLFLSILITLLVNDEFILLRGFIQIFKFVMFALIFSSTALLARSLSQKQALLVLGKASLILLVVQTVVVLITLFSPNLLDAVWSSGKTFGLGSLLRMTGTVYNPNSFGLLILNIYAALVLSPTPIPKKHFTAFIWCFALIVISGSRTSIIVMLVTSPIVFLYSSDFGSNILKSAKALIKITALLFVMVRSLGLIFQHASDIFPYISRMQFIFDELSFYSIVSNIIEQSKRGEIWQERWKFFRDSPSSLKWLLGLGPNDLFSISDNDFLYIFLHSGLIGVFLIYFLYLLVSFSPSGERRVLRQITIIIFI